MGDVPPGWTASRVHHWSEYWDYTGDDSNLHVERFTIPNLVPNLGLPGTGLNVSNAMLSSYNLWFGAALSFMGRSGMAVGIWEYRDVIGGPDLLGWHFVVLSHNSPSASPMVAPYAEVRPQVVSP